MCGCKCGECLDGHCKDCSDEECTDPNCEGSSKARQAAEELAMLKSFAVSMKSLVGAYTILINRENRTASDWFNGKDRMLQESTNTSFSVVGHLGDRGAKTTVTLYENIFAKLKVPYGQLPACFDVQRIDVSTDS